MPEALTSEEVEALLRLAEDGAGATPAPPGPTPGHEAPGFEPHNAIPAHQITLYDFRRPERVSKSQVSALQALHEVFARNVSASLSGYLRTMFEVRLVSVEQFTYSEFTLTLPTPTSFNLLTCEPLEGHVILEVNPSILFPVIDRLLGGGTGELPPLDRPFTRIEVGLVGTLLSRVLGQLRETWENVKEIDFQIEETESNPFLLQVVAPNEPIVLLTFEATMGDHVGALNLCIPFRVIEPLMPEFSQSSWFSTTRRRKGARGGKKILEQIRGAEVEISAILAETPLRLADILALRPGDIIDTGHRASAPITLCVEGRGKFRGVAGIRDSRKAVTLTDGPDRQAD